VSGGIGSGKSAAVASFATLGAVVIEADRIGHEILEPGGAAHARVAARWPQVVHGARIDRAKLAAIVFSDPEQLVELEAIAHPLIAEEIAARVAAAGDRDVVIELPLSSDLAGPGWTRVVVDAPETLRLERSVRRGMDTADVAGRMAAQPDREVWIAGADYVIDNEGTLDELEARVRELWIELTGQRDA
jgi:dephospho-CoA kinase